jgi:hypothetical protein
MRINDDICRCTNDTCPERETCIRWLERDSGRYRALIETSNDHCVDKIEYDVKKI